MKILYWSICIIFTYHVKKIRVGESTERARISLIFTYQKSLFSPTGSCTYTNKFAPLKERGAAVLRLWRHWRASSSPAFLSTWIIVLASPGENPALLETFAINIFWSEFKEEQLLYYVNFLFIFGLSDLFWYKGYLSHYSSKLSNWWKNLTTRFTNICH